MTRPSEFKEEYIAQAAKLCKLGATDAELGEFFEVSVRTIHRWKLQSEAFCHSIAIGKEFADNRVERALYESACGFAYVEQQAFKVKHGANDEEVEVVDVERVAPPDPRSMVFWLKNRRKDEWRDKVETGVTDKDGNDVPIDPMEAARRIAFVLMRGVDADERTH